MSTGKVDVLALLRDPHYDLHNSEEMLAAADAVAELIAADTEHDAARESLVNLNRRIAEQGWIDLEHDALRQAGERFVRAQSRRHAALDRVSAGGEA